MTAMEAESMLRSQLQKWNEKYRKETQVVCSWYKGEIS